MRSIVASILIGFGLLAAGVTTGSACAFHDQQASADTQQRTAQTETTRTQ